jgi:glycerophosphoryl diester phosphodiesterase
MKRPLLLGHRGARASHHIPENTLTSFELCLEHGCDGFELDVRRSADGQAVICHDPVVQGREISRTPSANLRLPMLDEVLHSFGGRAFLDIELKVSGLECNTLALLRERTVQERHVVSSFLPEVLSALHKLDSTVPLGLICETRAQLNRWRDLSVAWVMPQFDLVDSVLFGELQAAGIKIMVWTVNQEARLREFAKLGVHAVISDETELAARVLFAP